MKNLPSIALGLVCGLLAAGLIILVSSPPRGVPVALSPRPTAAPLMVHVAGAVEAPGVYEMPLNSRIQDAIQKAGGSLPDANINALNLADKVIDGQKIIVPVIGEDTAKTSSSASKPDEPTGLINLNTASQSELETLPGIGPAKATAIIDFRNTNGPFQNLEDLMQIPGIGANICEDIKDLIIIQ
jgi:competence protein ComEA